MSESAFLHGGDIKSAALFCGRSESEILDFSANINPLGMPEGIEKALEGSLKSALSYPDPFCRDLCEALSDKTGVPAANILCGNGGADLIYRLAYAVRPKKVLVTAPAFAEYEEASLQAGAEVKYYELGERLALSEDILSEVTEDLDLMFLCNPNNPTGILTERDLLIKILERAAGQSVRVCVDECFLDFVSDMESYSLKDFLKEYDNLIILKSFTKLYAMPGFRLGYVLSADTDLLEAMRKAGQPWGVSVQAEEAGIAALKAEGFRERTVSYVDEERDFLKSALEKFGFAVLDGRANYLCFRAEGDFSLQERLLAEGILIRSCANYRGLSADYYRAAVRTRQENERFTEALGKVCVRDE